MRHLKRDSRLPVNKGKGMGEIYPKMGSCVRSVHLEILVVFTITSRNTVPTVEQRWMRRFKMSNGVIITIIICLTVIIIASMGKK